MKFLPPHHVRRAFPLFAVVFSGLVAAQASVILNDQILVGSGTTFYTAGAIHNQGPASGTGWSSVWLGDSTSSQTANATNLTMTGLTGNNGAGSGSIRLASPGTAPIGREANRSFTASANQGTLWFSTVINPSASNANSQIMEGFLSGGLSSGSAWTNTSLQGFAWGLMGSSNLTVQYQTTAGGAGALATASSSRTFTLNTNYLLVAKLVVNSAGNDDLEVWFTSTVPTSESALGTADISITSADILTNSSSLTSDNLWLNTTSGASDTGNFDYINMGTTFDDVVAVPEPSTSALLLGLPAVAFALAMRRKFVG